ncbi:MAG: carbon-nitrogen hydrolase family protein [Gammaproteobacteria bacterium]|nr:carbon-nitrogen hydrolase family protein [Gammaproteobacteria bacterium]
MPIKTRVGIVQLCATNDVTQNLATTEELSQRAVAEGAEVVCLPEAFAYIGSDRERLPMLEDLEQGGPILDSCRRIATSHNVHVIAGGFPEKAPDDRAYNTCLHLTPAGTIAAAYRKIHLFDVDLSDGTRMLESRNTSPGDAAVTSELPFGTVGLTVCYDVRFPRLYQDLVDKGATALAVPAAFVKTTGRSHWHVLLRSRAIECQAYVIAAAQYGDHQHRNRKSYGHALIADPWGDVIAECADDADGFAVAELDPAEVTRVREELPSLKNRGSWV